MLCLAFLVRTRAGTGGRQAGHGLSSKAGRAAGAGVIALRRTKALLPHMKKINRRKGRAKQNVLRMI